MFTNQYLPCWVASRTGRLYLGKIFRWWSKLRRLQNHEKSVRKVCHYAFKYLTGGEGVYTISSVCFNGGNLELGKDFTGGIAEELQR